MPPPVAATLAPHALSWLNVALAAGLAAACALAFGRLRGTTLAAPAAWAVAAAIALGATELLLAVRPAMESSLAASLVRYAAAVGTFCPLVAVLGAKRPQDRGWQWVVASLWIILLVPAGQALAAGAADRLELAPVWRLMTWALIAMGLLNYLPTANALPALAASAAQACLFASYLWQSPPANPRLLVALGVSLLLIAGLLAALLPRISRPASTALTSLHPSSARWRTFRNAWGAFWSLRIQNRVNETAQLADWPVRLAWDGFTAEVDDRTAAQIQQSLDTLLRRFEKA